MIESAEILDQNDSTVDDVAKQQRTTVQIKETAGKVEELIPN